MANTPVINLEPSAASEVVPGGYPEKLELDRVIAAGNTKVDLFAGQLTASFSTDIAVTGSMTQQKNQIIGGAFTLTPRIITQVVAFAAFSGAGGVTTLDVQISGSNAALASIWSNDAQRVKLSSSLGNYGIARSEVAAAAWPANSRMIVVPTTVAGLDTVTDAQRGVVVSVFWKPSGSYA